jgi:hypothetical protein
VDRRVSVITDEESTSFGPIVPFYDETFTDLDVEEWLSQASIS